MSDIIAENQKSSFPLTRERNLILFVLSVLSILSWIVVLENSTSMAAMSLTDESILLFLPIWTAMMAAMMFPSAAPMIFTFSQIYSKQKNHGRPFVPTWVFAAGYLFVWIAFGAAVYFSVSLLSAFSLAAQNLAVYAGYFFIAAGIYQFSKLKNMCLSNCRSPFDFLMQSWRDGYLGSFAMGIKHGAYCFGCCWLLFVLLFIIGIMNITAMLLLTIYIFAEKTLPIGRKISTAAGIVLIIYGALIILKPL